MPKENAAEKLRESVTQFNQAVQDELHESDDSEIENEGETEHLAETPEQSQQSEYELPVTESGKPEIPGVPLDEQGHRPSENTIDFDRLRELLPEDVYSSVDQRFRSLYKQIKRTDAYWNQLNQDLPTMVEAKAQELLEQQQHESQAREGRKSAFKDALENMDYDKLANLLTEEPEPQQTQQGQDLDPVSLAKIRAFEGETDENNQLVRPWVLEGHPMRAFALGQLNSLINHPQMQGQPVDVILQTLDGVMSSVLGTHEPQPSPREMVRQPPQVLTGDSNLRSRRSEGKVTLSPEQKAVAERIFMAGRKDITKEEAYKRYLAGLKKTQGM